ncbi:MAG: Gfo/Idh/MocA family oxidoreductase [Victivallales bacterium]|nr:Gfo/Idh/MocA family oxidoreductase [Victivallales bacterium]
MHAVDHEPRIVILGCGRWGRTCHSQLIEKTPGLRLHGIAGRDPAKVAAASTEVGRKGYVGFASVLADPEVDGVVLATPNSTHADLAVQALGAGKHVLCEKVMCLNTAEFDRMALAAKESDRLLSVFQNRRTDGDFRTVCALREAGELGDVRWVEMAWQGFGIWGGWRGEAAMGGGKLYDLGAHMVDQILQLFPEPVTSVYCRMHHDMPERDVESEALVVISFASGRTAVVDASSLAAISKPRFYVRGTKGTFQKFGLDPQEDAMKAGDIETAVEPESLFGTLKTADAERLVPTRAGCWLDFYANWREALRGSAAPLVSLPEARRAIQVLEAAHHSAREGVAIHL